MPFQIYQRYFSLCSRAKCLPRGLHTGFRDDCLPKALISKQIKMCNSALKIISDMHSAINSDLFMLNFDKEAAVCLKTCNMGPLKYRSLKIDSGTCSASPMLELVNSSSFFSIGKINRQSILF